jgi:ornithine cyclodeaminase
VSRAPFTYYGPDIIRSTVGIEDVIEPVATALIDFSKGCGEAPVFVFAPAGPEGDVHVKSAWLPGRAIFTVKVATWFAARAVNGATPTAGVVAAFDARTGDLVALLEDHHHLSDIRTAAAGGLVARVLARPDSSALGVIGTGAQAYLQVLAAAAELPLRTVKVWGRNQRRAERLTSLLRERLPSVVISVAQGLRDVCESADVLITATSSAEPLIDASWLKPGMHITAVGADDSHKAELTAECFERAARVVVDSQLLSSRYGDLFAAGATAHAELGEVLAEPKLGRGSDSDITIGKLIGLGVQDLAAVEVMLDLVRRGTSRTSPPASALDLMVHT